MTGRYCSPHRGTKHVLAGKEGAVVEEIDLGRRSREGSKGMDQSAGKKGLRGARSLSEQRVRRARTRRTRGGGHQRRGGSKRRRLEVEDDDGTPGDDSAP
jgi:hypothetical protein